MLIIVMVTALIIFASVVEKNTTTVILITASMTMVLLNITAAMFPSGPIALIVALVVSGIVCLFVDYVTV